MAVVGLASSAASWHAAFSAPISEPVTISREAVLDMLKASNNTVGKNFVLVDLRRTDHEVCFLHLWSEFCTLGTDSSRVDSFAAQSICLRRLYILLSLHCTYCSRPQVCIRSSGTVVGFGLMFCSHFGTLFTNLPQDLPKDVTHGLQGGLLTTLPSKKTKRCAA